MASSKNLEYKKTSFLSQSNSSFIEEMYIKYIDKDPTLPVSWENYFNSLGEDLNLITKEIEGPIWIRNKRKKIQKKLDKELNLDKSISVDKDTQKSNKDSVRAVTLIRAYRTQGNLLAKLYRLGLKTSEYIDELHPEYHGFKKEDYDHKIFLDGIINKQYASVREILNFLRKTYCGPIGYEFMHISNPKERKLFRDRI